MPTLAHVRQFIFLGWSASMNIRPIKQLPILGMNAMAMLQQVTLPLGFRPQAVVIISELSGGEMSASAIYFGGWLL
jgi:hypothetical protein